MISSCGLEAMLKGQYNRDLELGTEHDVLGYCDKQKYEGHRLIKR